MEYVTLFMKRDDIENATLLPVNLLLGVVFLCLKCRKYLVVEEKIKMNYDEFIGAVQDYILKNDEWKNLECKFYPDGFSNNNDIADREFVHTTNIKYHSVESDVLIGDYIVLNIVKSSTCTSSCRFSVKYLYEEYQNGSWERVHHVIEGNILQVDYQKMNDLVSNLTDYDITKEKLIIRPLNYNDNRYELKNIVHKTYGDIALVLYAILYDDERGLGTMKIPKNVLDSWEKDFDEVWNEALLNTNIYALPRMYLDPMETDNPPFSLGAFMALDSKIKKLWPRQVPTITTTKKINGAIAMFYPGVMDKIAELYDSSYYIAFIGISDVRVHHKDSISPRNVLSSLKSINKVFPDELLSRKVFYYDKDTKELKALDL